MACYDASLFFCPKLSEYSIQYIISCLYYHASYDSHYTPCTGVFIFMVYKCIGGSFRRLKMACRIDFKTLKFSLSIKCMSIKFKRLKKLYISAL